MSIVRQTPEEFMAHFGYEEWPLEDKGCPLAEVVAVEWDWADDPEAKNELRFVGRVIRRIDRVEMSVTVE